LAAAGHVFIRQGYRALGQRTCHCWIGVNVAKFGVERQDPIVGELPFSGGPSEDAGASTASRYRFQHCCAAARLLAAIAADRRCEVICEWHEDFLVLLDGTIEAVSVKHREQTKTKWSVATLVSDGKLGHLYETFQRGDGGLQCSFVTNRSHTVADLWSEDPAKREPMCADLADRLGSCVEEVVPFVDCLRLDANLPARHYIVSVYANDLAAAALDRLGLRLDPTKGMRVAGDLVASASQEQVSPKALQAVLLAPAADRDAILAEHKVLDRRVTTEQVAEALCDAASDLVPRLPSSQASAEVPPETTLTKKLRKGGLGPSVLGSAGRRRARWYAHRARYRDIRPREEELDSLEEWVQDQANLAEIKARERDEESYGAEMFERLTQTLSSPEALPMGTRQEDSNPALLSGAAFELTDACSIWWSQTFPMDDDADA
jgi:hypothetical protein